MDTSDLRHYKANLNHPEDERKKNAKRGHARFDIEFKLTGTYEVLTNLLLETTLINRDTTYCFSED